MFPGGTLTARLRRWFTIQRPVSYWSFWTDLLRLMPLLATLFVLSVALFGMEFSVLSFAPLPFVFVTATTGYAIRDLHLSGSLWSALVALTYSAILWLTGTAQTLLQRPTPILTAVAILTFVALVAGFAAPSLHGQPDNQEFRAAYRRHQRAVNDD